MIYYQIKWAVGFLRRALGPARTGAGCAWARLAHRGAGRKTGPPITAVHELVMGFLGRSSNRWREMETGGEERHYTALLFIWEPSPKSGMPQKEPSSWNTKQALWKP